jgi:hypothetical protein
MDFFPRPSFTTFSNLLLVCNTYHRDNNFLSSIGYDPTITKIPIEVICYSLSVIRLKGMKSNFISDPLRANMIGLPSNPNND